MEYSSTPHRLNKQNNRLELKTKSTENKLIISTASLRSKRLLESLCVCRYLNARKLRRERKNWRKKEEKWRERKLPLSLLTQLEKGIPPNHHRYSTACRVTSAVEVFFCSKNTSQAEAN